MNRSLLSIVAVVGGLSVSAAQHAPWDPVQAFVRVDSDVHAASQVGSPSSPLLDYDFFKTRVQPIFVARRPGHARCVACHVLRTPLRLQPLAPGSTAWSEEDSRKNFDAVRRVVVPGSVKSRLLVHLLTEEAGGDFYHNGGKHWSSQDDPEWQTLKAWVLGQTTK
jgi:hypothetical protein